MGRTLAMVGLVGACAALPCAARGAPPNQRPSSAPASPTSQGKTSKLPAAAPAREYRFDALRFTGQLSGPHAVITYGRRAKRRPSLLVIRRSFVRRIYETLEAPALYR